MTNLLRKHIDQVVLLALFLEHSHSLGMVRLGVNVISNVVQHLNPGQTPVVAMDQPLFALSKMIQWNMPETHGKDRYVVMFGGLHTQQSDKLIKLWPSNSRSNWNLEMLVFEEGGKPENPERNPRRARARTSNKLNTHMMPGLEIEPGKHWWKVSALTTAPPLLPIQSSRGVSGWKWIGKSTCKCRHRKFRYSRIILES